MGIMSFLMIPDNFFKRMIILFLGHPVKEYEEAKLMIKPAKMIRRYKRKPYGLRWSSQNLHEIKKIEEKIVENSFCQNLLASFDY